MGQGKIDGIVGLKAASEDANIDSQMFVAQTLSEFRFLD